MFSGLYINYVIEIKTEGFIPAGPGGFIPDLLFYGVIPIAIVFYMLAEKSKIENWIEICLAYRRVYIVYSLQYSGSRLDQKEVKGGFS